MNIIMYFTSKISMVCNDLDGPYQNWTKTGTKNADSAESDTQKSKPSESNALRNLHLTKGSIVYRIM